MNKTGRYHGNDDDLVDLETQKKFREEVATEMEAIEANARKQSGHESKGEFEMNDEMMRAMAEMSAEDMGREAEARNAEARTRR